MTTSYPLGFIIGMVLLCTNQVVGWAGIFLGVYLGKKTGKKAYYALGTGIYVFSWGMVFAGAYLVGTEGMALAKNAMKSHLWLTISVLAVTACAFVWYYLRKRNKAEKNAAK